MFISRFYVYILSLIYNNQLLCVGLILHEVIQNTTKKLREMCHLSLGVLHKFVIKISLINSGIKSQQFCFCCHMLSGNCQAGPYLYRSGYRPTYDSRTKIVVFYSLSNAFDLISGSKFGEDISKLFRNDLRLSVGESILFKHACA